MRESPAPPFAPLMRMTRLISLPTLLFLCAAAAAQPQPSPQAVEFFETRVRPVLVNHCVGCRGPKKQMAGLRLDSREALLKGSDSGPVVLPGQPEQSGLLQAVRHDGDVKMPPKTKLPDSVVADLGAWVKMGL